MKAVRRIAVLLSFACIVHAQNPYVQEGPIGAPKADSAGIAMQLPTRALPNCIGERFIFLPLSRALQKYGYINTIYKGDDITGDESKYAYGRFAGKIARMIAVSPARFSGEYIAAFVMEDNGDTVRASTLSGAIHDMGPIADIDTARARWLHKTLWYLWNTLVACDETQDSIWQVKVRTCSPVKVTNIVAGSGNDYPVRFIVKTETGREGFVDCALSNTNIAPMMHNLCRFEQHFSTVDPHVKYHWPQSTWSAIEQGRVFAGMTATQARLSRGGPSEMDTVETNNGTTVQWVYGEHDTLVFTKGVLTATRK